MSVQITPVTTAAQKKAFIQFPWKLYANDPHWVAPLKGEIKKMFEPSHPFYEYGTMQLFLAYRNNEVVGRIAAIDNPLYNKAHNTNTGFFGFFECINDQAVANALLDTAKEWLQKRNFNIMHGPASPSSNYEFGALSEGFDDSPRIMMSYNPKYYVDLYEKYGLPIAKTLLAYKLNSKTVLSNDKLARGAELAKQRYKFEIRNIDVKQMTTEVQKVKQIYNEAWELNWGYVPLTDREIDAMAVELKPVADPAYLLLGYLDGKLVGMALAVLDFNYILRQLKGSLFPFGFIKFFTQKKHIKWLRIILLGLTPPARGKGLDAAFYYELVRAGMAKGIEFAEASWILEDNDMMNRGMKIVSGEVYKKYRVYELPI